MTDIKQLIDGVLKGDRRSIARTITIIENGLPESQKIVSLLYSHTGKAHVVGITGPTGSGKSTLIQKLVEELRREGKTVGVVAVDPSSPFTGGAFLGDRVRMQELSTDEGVFIRSMATRGSVGALAKATKDAVKVFDASGKDVVVVETVGAGQSEVEIVKVAHTIVVVLAPGLGDDIQAIKAGIMEIGDIFAVNKADRENANKAMIDIEAMLTMNPQRMEWEPPVVMTNAITGEGITELLDKMDQHREYLGAGAIATRLRERIEMELVEAIKAKVAQAIAGDLKRKGELDKLVQRILAKEIDPYSAADILLAKRLKRFKTS